MHRIAIALATMAMAATACGGSSTGTERAKESARAGPSAEAIPAPATASGLSAEALATRLGRKYRMPNPRDNTHSCRDAGCVQLITTDTVSIYQFPTTAAAGKYATAMNAVGGARRVRVFVLSWAGRRGKDLPSAKIQAGMVAEVNRIIKAS